MIDFLTFAFYMLNLFKFFVGSYHGAITSILESFLKTCFYVIFTASFIMIILPQVVHADYKVVIAGLDFSCFDWM